MKLTFLGAAREVTGSLYLLEVGGQRLLIDDGMEQGKDIFVNQPLPVAGSEIDCVILTHAHIDHSGNLPLLYKHGYRGPIFASRETCALCQIMLRDSAHIQEFEAEWRNRKAQRSGDQPFEPCYTMADAEGAIALMHPLAYEEEKTVVGGVTVRLRDAGHLLGSASALLTLTENGVTKKLVFSGDIGNTNQPILSDPVNPTEADFVVMETTYGDRSHGERPDYIAELTKILQDTFDRGGNVVIPSFAVGRTQEMCYFFRQIKEERRVKGHDDFQVYVDSPLAVAATNVFENCDVSCLDEEARALVKRGVNPIAFPGLRTSTTSDESRAINEIQGGCVILSASGMCEAGRIRHHLKHNLWRPESTVLFVGYQAEGTLGRALVDGAKRVKIFGESIEVRAQVRLLNGVSGHADREGLLRWAKAFTPAPTRYFLTHGDEPSALAFADLLAKNTSAEIDVPYNGDAWALETDARVASGSRALVEPGARADEREQNSQQRGYARLLAAVSALSDAIRANPSMKRREMQSLTDQIEALCNKID